MDKNTQSNLRSKTINGVFWKFGERGTKQLVTFIVSIILARIILPEYYGIIALIGVFTQICNKLVTSGFATSLIQKKDADDIDFSTVFYFSIGSAAFFYLLLFIGAPYIADFFDKFERNLLIQVIRVSGFQLFFMAINSVQHAYVSRTMQFCRFFYSTIGGTIASALVGIWMAYADYGVWALVGQSYTMSIVDTGILWFTVKWRPKIVFSWLRLKGLFSYGWKLFVASIIKTLYNDLRSFIIGKFYTPSDLAFYNRGQSFPQMLDTNISGTIDGVLFPAISKVQSSPEQMLSMLRRAIKTSTFILMPLLFGLAAMAQTLVAILLTERWLPSVPYMQILCFAFVLSPVEAENLQAIKAKGRSDLVLKLEILKKSIGLLLLVVAVPFGVRAIAYSMLVCSILQAVINALPNKSLLGYNYMKQIMDIIPSLLISLLMFAVVYFIGLIPGINLYIMALLQLSAGGIIYLSMSYIFKVDSLQYILQLYRIKFSKGK